MARYVAICHGCLSSDRRLSLLEENSDISLSIIRTLSRRCGNKLKKVRLCWECVGILNKFQKFLIQFRKAQQVLDQPLRRKVHETLSSLKTTTKCSYDDEIEYEKPKENNKTSEKSKNMLHEEYEVKTEIALEEREDELKEEPFFDDIDIDYDSYSIIGNVEEKYEPPKLGSHLEKNKICLNDDDDPINVNESNNDVDDKKDVVYKNDIVADIKSDVDCDVGNDDINDDSDDVKDDSSEDGDDKNDLDYIDTSFKAKSTPKKKTQSNHDHYTVIKTCEMDQDSIESYFTISQNETEMEDLSEERRTNDGKKYPFNCAKCKIGWYNILDMQIHTKSYNHQITMTAARDSSPPKSSFKATCKLCGKTHSHCFHNNKLHLTSGHRKVYACKYCRITFRSFPCPDCGKDFNKKFSMKCHYNHFHLKKMNFHCKPCNKYFSRAGGIKYHNAKVHLKVNPVKDKMCDLCGWAFSNNRTLRYHRYTHTGERPHKCLYCPAQFIQKFPMIKHMRTHHNHQPGNP